MSLQRSNQALDESEQLLRESNHFVMELFIVIEEIMKVMQDRQQKAKLPNLFAKLQGIISENRLLEKFEEMRRQINLQKSLTE